MMFSFGFRTHNELICEPTPSNFSVWKQDSNSEQKLRFYSKLIQQFYNSFKKLVKS